MAGAIAVSQLFCLALLVQPIMLPKPAVAKETMEAASPPPVSEEVINGKTFCTTKIVVHAKPERVFRILTDYQNASRVFPQLKQCKVLEDHGASKVVYHEVAPSGVPGTYEYNLEIKEVAPKSLEWHRISGDFKAVDGFWKLEPLEGGSFTLVTYSSYVNGGMFIPQILIKHQFKVDMPNVMTHLKNESEGSIQIARKPGGSNTQ